MLLFPVVVISTLVGNIAFFNSVWVIQLSISASFLASIILSHLAFFLLYSFMFNPLVWFWNPWTLNMTIQPFLINFYCHSFFFLHMPWISLFVSHWLPLFVSLAMTPILGKIFVYVITTCHWQDKIHFQSQRLLYLVGGLLISGMFTDWSLGFLHPEIWFAP